MTLNADVVAQMEENDEDLILIARGATRTSLSEEEHKGAR
jgi:hypothetical protein